MGRTGTVEIHFWNWAHENRAAGTTLLSTYELDNMSALFQIWFWSLCDILSLCKVKKTDFRPFEPPSPLIVTDCFSPSGSNLFGSSTLFVLAKQVTEFCMPCFSADDRMYTSVILSCAFIAVH